MYFCRLNLLCIIRCKQTIILLLSPRGASEFRPSGEPRSLLLFHICLELVENSADFLLSLQIQPATQVQTYLLMKQLI